ncbi:MAG: hypothetical protein PHD82_13300 [Candidatus Riflebacteria bacterium]|nr:hypothetical protein [Candidatus Riflebacteria bacterium]
MNQPAQMVDGWLLGLIRPAFSFPGPTKKLFSTILCVIIFLGTAFPALAINSPTITSVAGHNVAPDTLMYANSDAFQVRGNAEAGTTITLYRGTVVVSTATTAGDGVWAIDLTAQTQGSFSFSAEAFDGIFTSERGVAVPVIIDWTPPVIDI